MHVCSPQHAKEACEDCSDTLYFPVNKTRAFAIRVGTNLHVRARGSAPYGTFRLGPSFCRRSQRGGQANAAPHSPRSMLEHKEPGVVWEQGTTGIQQGLLAVSHGSDCCKEPACHKAASAASLPWLEAPRHARSISLHIRAYEHPTPNSTPTPSAASHTATSSLSPHARRSLFLSSARNTRPGPRRASEARARSELAERSQHAHPKDVASTS